MRKSVTMVMALVVVFGGISLAQATFIADFESPAFTADIPVDSQNGWIAAGRTSGPSIPNPKVVILPAGSPAVLGAQMTEIGRYTDHSLIGAGFTDVTPVSLMTAYAPSNGEVAFTVYGANLTATGKVAKFRIYGGNRIYYTSDRERILTDLGSNDTKLWKLDLNLDFNAQQYEGVWTDLGTSNSYTTGWMGFMNPCTKAQAEASGYFSSEIISVGGPQYLDNVSVGVVAEPSTFALVVMAGMGLLAYAWRRQR